ncbi:MAG: class I SAM-dependent methyltransferase [Acidimicrobiia bacterium]
MQTHEQELPYFDTLDRAGHDGRILHRDDIYCSGPPSSIVCEPILDFAIRHVGDTFLDVGCGIGPYLERLTALGRRGVGVELSSDQVETARALGRDVRMMSALDLDFADRSFDSVVMVEVLEHLPDPERALAEAARVGRANLVMTVPDISCVPLMSSRGVVPWHLLESTHVNFFTPESLRRVLLRHFDSVEVTQLVPIMEIDGVPAYTHIAAVAWIGDRA